MAPSAAASAGFVSSIGSDAAQHGLDGRWIHSHNRKLRNLLAISLRNLSFEKQSETRARGNTIDDDAVPNAFCSPAKLRALREERTLGYSHSSTDLRHDSARSNGDSPSEPTDDLGRAKVRPWTSAKETGNFGKARPGRNRRRSTLEWINSGLGKRQERLEQVVRERTAGIFFTIHVYGVDKPIYISETIKQTMNPSFRLIDLDECGPGILRQSDFMLRVWVQPFGGQGWQLLTTSAISLPSLQFIGEGLETSRLAWDKNTIIFHFRDGIYTTTSSVAFNLNRQKLKPATDLPQNRTNSSSRQSRTSSFDTLLKLAKLTDSIQDALATKIRLVEELDQFLQTQQQALMKQDMVDQAKDRLKTINFAKSTVVKQVEKARKQISERRAALSRRRDAMSEDLIRQHNARDGMQTGLGDLPHLRDESKSKKKAITSQRRRMVEDVSRIFPINPVEGGKVLSFKICGLLLPNSESLDSTSADKLDAAFGLVAQLTLLISFYFQIPLAYPVNPMGSSSWITDSTSLVKSSAGSAAAILGSGQSSGDDRYPLHLHRAARFRFEYAVFLINKDIQLLLESGFGVRVLDIRHTLPNLKYLLYVASAGEGELPGRKAGGVKGLMKGTAGDGSDRKGSTGSVGSVGSRVPLTLRTARREAGAGGKEGQGAIDSLRELTKS